MKVNVGARPPSPSCRSRLDPRRRVDLLSLALFLLPPFPSLPRPHPRSRPRPCYFLISPFSFTSPPAPARATRTLYARRCLRNPHTSSRFDDKIAVVDLLPPRSGSYKIILISPFPPVGLIFRFVSCPARRRIISYFFPSITMDAVKNLFTSRAPAPVRLTGLAAVAATAATAAVGGSGSPGSLQSRFKAQTVHLRDIQYTQRPKNI